MIGTDLAVAIVVLCIKEYDRDWKRYQVVVKRLQTKAIEEKIQTLESELPSSQG
ncbi:MAG: hypothetical protein HZB37_05035, partial [Planctomycetes bacterium]|nr:hypothetical protein [Planctomycetota bacterium]